MNVTGSRSTNGFAAAAILAPGVGSLVLGVLTVLKAASVQIKQLLSFYPPTGPLSGQTTLAVGAWLLAWLILRIFWKDREVNFRRVFLITWALIGLGLVGTFPPLFEEFFETYE